MHILIIDDQKADRLLLKKTLQPFFDVTTLSSAHEAVTFGIDNTFDIVLITVTTDKFMQCVELFHDLQFSQCELIGYALTGSGNSIDAKHLINVGFREVIEKPFELEAFIELLKKEEYKFSSYANYININKESVSY
jgi:DNA-binding NtrC family response regulator